MNSGQSSSWSIILLEIITRGSTGELFYVHGYVCAGALLTPQYKNNRSKIENGEEEREREREGGRRREGER